MKLENQVTNLELSKKLKELGVEQESLYYWVEEWHWDGKTHDGKSWSDGKIYLEHYYNSQNPKLIASAFTVAELGEMLPDWCNAAKGEGSWGYNFVKGGNFKQLEKDIEADTEANARAKMLIYLIENKLLK